MRQQAELGEYLAFDSHLPTDKLGPPWRPLQLSEGSLASRVDQIRAALIPASAGSSADRPSAVLQARVAASVTQLGMTARLISPVLGQAVVASQLLELTDLYWQPTLGGAFALSIAAGAAGAPTQALVDNLVRSVIAGPVRELLDLTVRRSVSPAVAWGNVASAVNGAACMIARSRPDLAARAAVISSAILAHSSLTATWTGTPTLDFQRRSCCLIYRLAASSGPDQRPTCEDCLLAVSLHGKRSRTPYSPGLL